MFDNFVQLIYIIYLLKGTGTYYNGYANLVLGSLKLVVIF